MSDRKEMEIIEPELMEVGTALQAQVRAETDVQIATAKKYPREISRVRKTVLELATCDDDTAASCFYAIPRDGKVIEGPTIRLAEIVASSYGNIKCASRVLGIEEKHVVCQAVCIDLENNNSASVEVRRKIINKYGKRYSEDMITTTANAGCAIAFRNAIFKVVPTAILKSIIPQIKAIGLGDKRTLSERRKAAIEYFKGNGIKREKVCNLLEVSDVDDIGLDHMRILRGVIEAIKEGTTTIEQAFANTKDKDDPFAPGRHEMSKKAEKNVESVKTQDTETLPPDKAEAMGIQTPQDDWKKGTCAQYKEIHAIFSDGRKRAKMDGVFAKVSIDSGVDIKHLKDIGHDDVRLCTMIMGRYNQ